VSHVVGGGGTRGLNSEASVCKGINVIHEGRKSPPLNISH
jgi:hypothetical protein